MDKTELTNKIRGFEGFTDEEKSILTELLHKQKKYGLIWEDKPEDAEERLRNELPVLKEVKERAVISDDKDTPNHILIEGDNLEALTALSYTHAGRIDVIYIDPPYNTGNKDFVYNDSFADKEDGYRHSKWLSFMKHRLDIAHGLLSDKGVIFISIDDNEQAQLKLLCDGVFGEGNFIGSYFWKRTNTPPALSYKIRRKLEFVICYQKKDIPRRTFVQGYTDGGDVPLLNSGNHSGVLEFPEGSVHFGLPDGIYTNNSSYKITLLDDVIVKNGRNENKFRAQGTFKWGQRNLDREVSEGTYFLIKSRQFSVRFQKAVKSTKVPSNIIDDDVSVGTNEDAKKEISNLDIDFSYAKPLSLITFLLKMPFWNDSSIIILDFFAGSGTTLHAAMKLNSEDGGNRQCILVTNNENNICEEVTYVRNKKVIEGYTTPKGERISGLKNNNLRYYKTGFISRKCTIKDMCALLSASTELLCIKNNVYTEQQTFGGHKLNPEAARYFDDGKTKMLVIYNESDVDEFVSVLSTMDVKRKIKVYIFSDNRYACNDNFKEVLDKVELCALPAAIYEAYNIVLKPVKNENEEGYIINTDNKEEEIYGQE